MEVVFRAAAVFLFLWVVTRSLGKRELGEMTVFELVMLVTIGDMVQQGVTQEDMSVTGAILSVGTIAVLVLASSYVGFRWRKTRPAIEGFPVVIVRDGHVLSNAAHVERVTEDEILEAARERGIEDLATVRIGILEADGKFTFIAAEELQAPEQSHHS